MTRSVLTIPGLDAVFFSPAIPYPQMVFEHTSDTLLYIFLFLGEKRLFFWFRCVCVKELVFLELSYYEGDKELTKKTCISSLSHRWFAECVSATGWVDMLKQE